MTAQATAKLKITVLRKGGEDRDQLVEQIARAVIAQLFSTRLANTLRLRIECRSTKLGAKTDGCTWWEKVEDHERKGYTIRIQRDAGDGVLAETIAHDLRHVEQFARGRYRWGTLGGKPGIFWRPGPGPATFHPKGATDYWTSPWEVEARATEHLGVKALLERRAPQPQSRRKKILDPRHHRAILVVRQRAASTHQEPR